LTEITYLIILFLAKVLDNALGTAKTILVQHNRSVLAGIALGLSNFIYFLITKNIVESDGVLSIVIVSVASGVGCCLAIAFNNHFSKDKTYVNVILSDNVDEMMALRDFLAANKITNVVSDSYDRDWKKVLSITAYLETKDESKLIDEYMKNSDVKFKRLVQNKRVN
jgi:hypothetical protein